MFRIHHRTSFKHKVFLGICMLLVLYVYFFNDSSLLGHIKIRLLSMGNGSSGALYQHQLGQIVNHRNGSFLYFHLPSLNDLKIERDFYRLNSLGVQVDTENKASKYCLRRGAGLADIQGNSHIFCVCKANYTGSECAIPPLVYQTVDPKLTANISRLRRPRRILVSLIWPTYEYDVANETSKELRLQRFARALEAMSQYVDLFIIHEIRIVSNTSASAEDRHSLVNQFRPDGALAKHALYSLLFSKVIVYRASSAKSPSNLDLSSYEFEATRKSWQVFTTQITEYRPADLLIFLSINNFPSETLLLYFKYHAGLMDILHLQPIRLFSVHHRDNGSLEVSSSIDEQATSSRVNSFLDLSKHPKVPLSSRLHTYHLRNVIITFEFMTFLCRFSFDDFLTNYCLTDQRRVARFQKNFWPINLVTLGNEQLNLSSTFSIL